MSEMSTGRDQFLDLFVFETNLLIVQLEKIIIQCEETKSLQVNDVNEIFRIMHTTKSSASMMGFSELSKLAHSLEDLFAVIRSNPDLTYDFNSYIHLILASIDYIKLYISNIESGNQPPDGSTELENQVRYLIKGLDESGSYHKESNTGKETEKSHENEELPKYYLHVFFGECGQAENIRSHLLAHTLKKYTTDLIHFPKELLETPQSAGKIRKDGVYIFFNTEDKLTQIEDIVKGTLFLSRYELKETADVPDVWNRISQASYLPVLIDDTEKKIGSNNKVTHFDFMAVKIDKLDALLNLVGEIVISESLVSKSPDLKGLKIEQFRREADRLGKLVKNLQDIVLEMRMVPLEHVFQKMKRTVINISEKLQKEISLEVFGEDTEVDKKITEYLSDPLTHLIRNAADHGIESREDRIKAGKSEKGAIKLSARQVAGEVWITVEDDGKGIDKQAVYEKALKNGLVTKPIVELSDKEIFAFVMMPGISTKENVTELSGRGVGMDVVRDNIEKMSGSVQIESKPGEGTKFTLRIPLTLSIMGAMQVMIGNSIFSIPIAMVRESILPGDVSVTTDLDGKEIVLLRGICYPVIRLDRYLGMKSGITDFKDGILILVEGNEKAACLYADKLIGQQLIVVKPLPDYIDKADNAFASCTILGDGSISLIMDINELLGVY